MCGDMWGRELLLLPFWVDLPAPRVLCSTVFPILFAARTAARAKHVGVQSQILPEKAGHGKTGVGARIVSW